LILRTNFIFFVKGAESEEEDEGRLLDAIGDEGAVGGSLGPQVSGGSSIGEPVTQKQKMNISPPKHADNQGANQGTSQGTSSGSDKF
jgi:hypothetical protein